MIFDVFLAGFTKENETMALDQSALTDLLDALRSGGDLDFMREAMQLVLLRVDLVDLDLELAAPTSELLDAVADEFVEGSISASQGQH